MTNREINIRSVLFLVVGILLVLSLIICIYIVVGERDLVKVEATVIDIKEDNEGTGKNSVSVVYEVNGVTYEYNFRYKNEIKVNDKLVIYYHKNSVTSVQTFKTSKIIFICPLIGLVLCGIGLYELFRKNKGDSATPVKIPTLEKKVELATPVAPKPIEPIPVPVQAAPAPAVATPAPVEAPAPAQVQPQATPAPAPVQAAPAPVEEKHEVVDPANLPVKKEEEPEPAKSNASSMKSLDDVADKVRDSVSKTITADSSDEDIKDVIKSVLKEVIKEVNEEKTPPKEVVQKRVIPNYFYISGTSLIYEEVGKKAQELNLKDIKRIVRTINSVGSVVKLVISNDEYKIILTNMKNIDLEQLANLLHNKMRTIDDTFKEIIERKEY